MADVPAVSGKQAVRAFERLGYEVVRVRGSHHVLSKPGQRILVIPVHANRALGRGILRSLLAAAEISVDEFRAAL